MCGFVGIYNRQININFDYIIRHILHRGPDEIGYYKSNICTMFSSRLAIRDINEGKQPFLKKKDNYNKVLSYNGEIYNFDKLKYRIKGIKSSCDTELIYEIFNNLENKQLNNELNKLEGQFAISFYNSKTKTLYLARDKLGEKPLFWTNINNSIVFASEIKPIISIRNENLEFDNQQVLSLNYLWSTHPAKTPYKNIYSIEPGAIYKFKTNGNFEKKFYEKESHNIHLKKIFYNKSKNIAISDREVGVYLSGGVDSFISTKLLSQNRSKIKSFGITFKNKNFDEGIKQTKISRILNTDHHKVEIDKNDFLKNLIKSSFHAEIPNTRFAHIPMFLLSKKVKSKNVPVIITGEGADEFFLGYDVFLENFLINNYYKIRNKNKFIKSMFTYMPQNLDKEKFINYKLNLYKNLNSQTKKMSEFGFNTSRILMGEYFHRVFYPNENKKFINEFKNYIKKKYKNFNKLNNLKKTQLIEIETLLTGNLLSIQGDRMSMAHSIETRSPFLDKTLISINLKKISDIYSQTFKQKPVLKKIFFKNYAMYEKIFKQKFPFRAPENLILNNKGEELFKYLLNSNKYKGLNFDNKSSLKLFKELKNSNFQQPSKLQAITLVTNIHSVYYALSNISKYLIDKSILKKFKTTLSIKNEKFELEVFKK